MDYMQITIFGAGLAGSYLANLLRQQHYTFSVIEPNLTTSCPSPCAFGFANFSSSYKLLKKRLE